jgi:hypothetical protein
MGGATLEICSNYANPAYISVEHKIRTEGTAKGYKYSLIGILSNKGSAVFNGNPIFDHKGDKGSRRKRAPKKLFVYLCDPSWLGFSRQKRESRNKIIIIRFSL